MSLNVTSCYLFVINGTYIIIWGDTMLVHRERISNSIDKKLYESLKKLSETSRIPISKYLDEAIEDLLKKHSAEK